MKLHTLLIGFALVGSYAVTAQTAAPANLSKRDSAMIASYEKVKDIKETVSSGPVYDEYYNKLKELELKRLNSYSYKEFRKVNKIFMKKVNYKGKLTDISNDILGYVKRNLQFTSFTSFEEAENEWAKVMHASDELGNEHYEYYVYLFEAIKVCGPEIAGNILLDIMNEYPELY